MSDKECAVFLHIKGSRQNISAVLRANAYRLNMLVNNNIDTADINLEKYPIGSSSENPIV